MILALSAFIGFGCEAVSSRVLQLSKNFSQVGKCPGGRGDASTLELRYIRMLQLIESMTLRPYPVLGLFFAKILIK
jgi:hypothetical protein